MPFSKGRFRVAVAYLDGLEAAWIYRTWGGFWRNYIANFTGSGPYSSPEAAAMSVWSRIGGK